MHLDIADLQIGILNQNLANTARFFLFYYTMFSIRTISGMGALLKKYTGWIDEAEINKKKTFKIKLFYKRAYFV